MKGLWSKMTNPVETLASAYDGFKDTINGLYEEINSMSGYEKSKGGSYLGTNISLSAADPLGKVVQLSGGVFFLKIGKVLNEIKYFKILSKLKPIKSIDSHVFTDHTFGANTTKSKFLEGADIEAVIKEGYSKKGRKAIEAASKHPQTGQTIDTIKVEMDRHPYTWTGIK